MVVDIVYRSSSFLSCFCANISTESLFTESHFFCFLLTDIPVLLTEIQILLTGISILLIGNSSDRLVLKNRFRKSFFIAKSEAGWRESVLTRHNKEILK
jgi:hypothetical protein